MSSRFETRRASSYWLLEQASLYKPVVWEYSRLSVTHNVMSKRKLAALVPNTLVVPSSRMPLVEDLHMAVCHGMAGRIGSRIGAL